MNVPVCNPVIRLHDCVLDIHSIYSAYGDSATNTGHWGWSAVGRNEVGQFSRSCLYNMHNTLYIYIYIYIYIDIDI